MLRAKNLEAGKAAAFLAAILLHCGAAWLLINAKPTLQTAIPRVENFRMVDLPSRPAPPLPSPIIETAPEPVAIFEPAPAPKPVLADKPKPKPIPVKKPLAVPAPVIEVAPSPTAVIAPPAPIIEKYIPPSSDADYLRNPPPAYPLAARKRGIEGVVRLNVEVSADGAALAVNIAVSSGFAPLDEAALAAVRNWRFEPAKRGGKAVSARVEIPLRFKLSN